MKAAKRKAVLPSIPKVRPPVRQNIRTAKSLMTPTPVTTSPDSALRDAIARMVDEDIRHLPVIDAAGKLVGMLSERDARSATGDLREFAEGAPDESDDPVVGSVMTRDPVAIELETPIEEIVEELIAGRYGALPVVDANSKLVGIVSYIDVLRALVPSAAA